MPWRARWVVAETQTGHRQGRIEMQRAIRVRKMQSGLIGMAQGQSSRGWGTGEMKYRSFPCLVSGMSMEKTAASFL
jgi:hypothetical protein